MKTQLKLNPNDTCLYDIESTNLSANYGIVLCAVVKPLRLPPRIFRLDDYRSRRVRDEDKPLIKDLIKELNKYEYIISYNGVNFDNKFINTRALYHEVKPLEEKLQVDLLHIARRVFRTNNRRLDTIATFLDLPEHKTSIDPKYWRWAMLGDSVAMDYVVRHCVQDVKVLELTYEKLKGYVKNVRRR